MSEPGRPKALDDAKQASVCSLVAAGVSLRQVAHFVSCDPKSIRREAERNDRFRAELARAKTEAKIHPLVVLRRAAQTDWRAALCWMERIDPDRFARPDATQVTKREANQFVRDLVESIDRAVSDPSQREDLFQLLSAAMPVAMRRRWDGGQARRRLQQVTRDFDNRTSEGLPNCASPGVDFVPPPGRNPADIAPPPPAKLGPANDLPRPDEANSTE